MIEKKNFYINGKWAPPSKPNDFEVIDPSTEEPFAIISLEISPLIVKIFKDGQKTYGSRAWSSMIVKRMEDLNKIDFRAKGFPNELIDNEPEEKGYEI